MKKIFLSILIFLVGATILIAQEKKVNQVKAAVEKLKTVLISGDRELLAEITMDQLSYGHSSGIIENKSQFIEKLASGQSDFVTIQTSDETISISGKVALVRHRLDAQINDNGKAGEVHLLVLLVWQKSGKTWKLLARQAVKAQ